MNFELKFSSAKGDFTLNVDFLGVLDRRRIPFIYIVAQESSITSTDQAALQCISDNLLRAPLSSAHETRYTMLVQANETRWLLFGRKEDGPVGKEVLRIKARIMTGHVISGWTRPQLQNDQSAFLTKMVRSALHEHARTKKKPRQLPQIASQRNSSDHVDRESCGRSSVVKKVKRSTMTTAQTTQESFTCDQALISASNPLLTKTPDIMQSEGVPLTDKMIRDKLKKIIVTLLSLHSIPKTHEAFKGLYQHTLQAAAFALRQVSTIDMIVFEEQAMSVSETLIKVFLRQDKE